MVCSLNKVLPMSRRWTIFWIIWLAAFLPVVWSLRSTDSVHVDGRKAIARVEKTEGNVTVRSESHMTWQKVTRNQELFNNDLISTENKSRVSIIFENGRKLQLTPGSVVKLGMPSPLSKDTEVSVLKGRAMVKAEEPNAGAAADAKSGTNPPTENAQLIIKKGSEKFVATSKPMDINSRDQLPSNEPKEAPTSLAAAAFAMASGAGPLSGPQKAQAIGGVSLDSLKNLALNDSMKLSAATPAPAIPEKCEPIASPDVLPLPLVDEKNAEEKASVPSYQASLVPQILPLSGEFWTAEPLKQVTDKALRLDIDPPSNLPADVKNSWKGIVNISGPSGHIRIDGKANGGKKKLSITLKELMAAKVIKDINQASFAVNAGYSVESESFSDAIEHSAPTTGVYSLRSLAEGEGIMIGVDKLQIMKSQNPWLFVNPKASNRIWIGVTEPEDRRRLFELVQGNAGQVSRADWPGIPARGAYIVRDDKIVGIVNGSGITSVEYDKIRRLLGADLIYRGTGNAYISRQNFDLSKTNERRLYILNRGDFVEVDVSLLRSRPRSMNFVNGVSSYLFREQTEILSVAR